MAEANVYQGILTSKPCSLDSPLVVPAKKLAIREGDTCSTWLIYKEFDWAFVVLASESFTFLNYLSTFKSWGFSYKKPRFLLSLKN